MFTTAWVRTRVVVGVVVLCAAATAVRADLTPIQDTRQREKNHVVILEKLYGGTFEPPWSAPGAPVYSNGTVTATRVSDFGLGGTLNVLTGNEADDQVWSDGATTITARARFAGLDQAFGYIDQTTGTYTELFEVFRPSKGILNLPAVSVDLTGHTWTWVRSDVTGDPDAFFGGDGVLGDRAWSSRVDDNADGPQGGGIDHLVTYRITGLEQPGTVWLLLWEDLPGPLGHDNAPGRKPTDRDLNDLVVEVIALPGPDTSPPGGGAGGADGTGGAGGTGTGDGSPGGENAGDLVGSGTTTPAGAFDAMVINDAGVVLAEITVSGAVPGQTVTYRLTEARSGDPPGPGGGTFAGFGDGVALGRTLTVETQAIPGSVTVAVAVSFGDDELTAAGLAPDDIQLHVLDTSRTPPAWEPAGSDIGMSEPTGVVGDAGFYRDDEAGRWVFWAVRDRLSVFAVGVPEAASVAEQPGDEPQPGSDVAEPPPSVEDGGPPAGAASPPVETSPPQDDDADGIDNAADRCPDTPPGATVDGAGCPIIGTVATQPAPSAASPCGQGVAPCGAAGVLSLWAMTLGFVHLRASARHRYSRRR